MKCADKEQETCQVEKMSCEGCAFDTCKQTTYSIINKCDSCKLKECIGCEITWSEIQEIKEYIKRLEKHKKEDKE